MSKNKKRTPEEKMQIVLEAMQNDSIAETCRKYGIYESQFYQWKKKLIGSADKVFRNTKKKDPEKEQLKDEVERLKQTLVEQTCELQILKKNDR
jgi:transposase-like protein